MDPRRITSTGTTGAFAQGASIGKQVGIVQNRATGGLEIPRFSCFISTSGQSIPHNTWTTMAIENEECDTHDLFAYTSTYEFQFGPDSAGLWFFSIYNGWASNTTGSRRVRAIIDNASTGTVIPQSNFSIFANSVNGPGDAYIQSQFMITMQENNKLFFQTYQSSGANLTLEDGYVQGFKLGV